MLRLLTFIILFKCCSTIIYQTNQSEYNKMPQLYELDDYDQCLSDESGIYCVANFDLFSRTHSDLMQFIQNYSDYSLKHYNHTQIHRGVCVTNTCERYLEQNKTDLNVTLGRCLNESIWNNYKIEAEVADLRYCKRKNENKPLDTADYIVAVVYVIIIMLAFLGSTYDYLLARRGIKKGNQYVLAFSLHRNWRALWSTRPLPDPRLERLKFFYGLRSTLILLIIIFHTTIALFITYVDNPLELEESYKYLFNYPSINGGRLTSLFFFISSFFVAYNFSMTVEHAGFSWSLLPKAIILRWVRLTPSLALVLATIITWVPRLGDGPLWDEMVTFEATTCRGSWWTNILYVNNYVRGEEVCMLQTWYLATDTQLYYLSILVCMTARSPRVKMIVLPTLVVVSSIIVAAATYFQNLGGVIYFAPESLKYFRISTDTFWKLHAVAHGHISNCSIGLACGFLTFHWQTTKKDFTKYKIYGWLNYPIIGIQIGLVLMGKLFYSDTNPPSRLFHIVYVSIFYALNHILFSFFIISCIFKMENIIRYFFEWDALRWMGRISYSLFLVHFSVVRAVVGSQRNLIRLGLHTRVLYSSEVILGSFVFATALWLLVENPINSLFKIAMRGKQRRKPSLKEECEVNMQNVATISCK